MLRRLVRNTTLNLAAFGIMAVIGFATVAWTVGAYGLHLYGIIAFARYLLPTGMLSLLDLGISDAAARLVARSQARGDSRETGEVVTVAVTAGVMLGVVPGLAMMAAAGPIAGFLLPLSGDEALAFARIVFWTGAALPALMLGQMVEGVLKGMNRFRALRAAEVSAGIFYAAAVALLVHRGADFAWIALGYLGTSVLRTLAEIVWLLALARTGRWRPSWPGSGTRRAVSESSWLLLQSKLAGTAATYVPSLVIGRFVGAAGVGTFDVLARIPRLVKVVFGVTTQALVPPAAALDAQQAGARLGELGRAATYGMLAAVTPPVFALALHGDWLLDRWLGPDLVHLAPWLGLFMMWPLLLCTYQGTNAILSVRVEALRTLNVVNLLQLAGTILLALLLVGRFREFAFVIAIVVAECVALPWRMRVYARHTGTTVRAYAGIIARVLWPALPAALISLGARRLVPGDTAGVLVGGAAGCVAHWAMLYFLGTAEDRSTIRRTLASLPFTRYNR